jgi:DNA-binding PadR family transcriptional regulator
MAMESFAVQHAVIGFLLEEPLHGYALRERIRDGIGGFWRVASSQLYAVLHRLESTGWVTAAHASAAGGPERTVYTTTRKAEKEFWAWCVAPVPHLRDLRVELFAKLYFVRRLRPHLLPELLEAQRTSLATLRAAVDRDEALAIDDPQTAHWARAYRRSQVDAAITWIHAVERELGKENAT